MEGKNEYEMAAALLRFKEAYASLCAASRKLPDLDVSDNYPFYLLDFEEIELAVMQWCTIQSNKLMEQVPDRVDNPACVECANFRCGLATNGMCKGGPCNNYPYIIFSEELCLPLLFKKYTARELAQLTSGQLYAKYIEVCNNLAAEKKG